MYNIKSNSYYLPGVLKAVSHVNDKIAPLFTGKVSQAFYKCVINVL